MLSEIYVKKKKAKIRLMLNALRYLIVLKTHKTIKFQLCSASLCKTRNRRAGLCVPLWTELVQQIN